MTFTPLTMDGQAAAARMLAQGTCTPYTCLATVHGAFPFTVSDAPGQYTHALVEWERCPTDRRHPGDPTPPAGAIVLWDLYVRSLGYNAGHIAISVGGGQVVSTDWPVKGRIGVANITDITKAWNATYLGWTNRIGGHTVTTAATPAPSITVPEEDTMALIIRRTSDGIIGLVAPQLWAHMPDEATAKINAAVNSASDEIHDLNPDEFDRVTRSLGIPDDQRVEGRFWSIQSDLQHQLRELDAKLSGSK